MQYILEEFYNVKQPFKKNGKLSIKGKKAYNELIDLLYAVNNLINIDIDEVVDTLEELANEDYEEDYE